MSSLNIRHTSEFYDPKQRIVGGIVLILLMLLLYAVLKALLGISAGGAVYALRNALPEETLLTNPEGAVNEEQAATGAGEQAGAPRYSIVEGFVFLDLSGNPMVAGGQAGEVPGTVAPLPGEAAASGEKRWAVQAASFREQERADKFVAQLKAKGIEGNVVKASNNWYAVRMAPQNNRRLAEQQLLELRQKTGKKGLLLQLE